MKITQLKIDTAQDGAPISNEFIENYGLSKNDLFYSNKNEVYSNFVGVVQRGDRVLISIPKHFKYISEFQKYNDERKKKYIRLIMDSINESIFGYQNSAINNSKEVSSDFALDAYFKIYHYYSQYGLYHEEHQEIKPNKGNKISWKETLHRSNKFINNGNIIFSPLFFKKKITDETIITECMVFAINYTQSLLGDLMTLPSNSKIAGRGVNPKFLNNSAIIYKLQEILSRTFKDINKQLILNLIIFLKKVNSCPRQIPDIKYYNFASTWEQAVHKYLNEHFDKVDEENNIIFTPLDTQSINNNFVKKSFNYNVVKKYRSRRLEPDHYLKDDKQRLIYIFDSKYYRSMNDLNHKQFVYHVLISNKYQDYKIFDCLVMPFEKKTKTEDYVNISNEYLLNNKPITIYLTRLNMVEVLENYVE